MFDPRSSKTTGFHLFAELVGELKNELQETIAALAEEYGGPVFPPHITILSRAEGSIDDLITKTEALVASTHGFEVTLGELHAEGTYFRSLYIAIDTNTKLMQFHEKANGLFSMKDAAPYTPHISLLYGNYSQERKAETIKVLQYPQGVTFKIDRIHLYRTEGEVGEWKKIQEFNIP